MKAYNASGLRELLRARLDWRRRFEIDLDFGDETDAEKKDNQQRDRKSVV